jgi:hypothetical protein
LSRIASLRELNVGGSKVTAEGIKKLQRIAPRIEINK